MIKISPSTINLVLECERCFYLHVVKKIKRPETPFPSLPSGMDKILKEHFDRFMEKDLLPPEIKENKECKSCKLFSNKEKLKIWRNNKKGLEYEQDGILLHGAIDNVLVKDKKLIVLDYKTRGYPLKEDTHEHYQAQMDLYNFLLRKNLYDTEDYAYLLFYYPNKVLETGEVIFDTVLKKINTGAEDGRKIFLKAIEIIKSKNIPESNKDCNFCNFFKKVKE